MKISFKLLLSDVDGTMTDGGRYLSESGLEFKKFHIPDGMGLFCLRRMGIKIGLITADSGALAKSRGESLKLDYTITGVNDKLTVVKDLVAKIGISLSDVAYIGDDLNDYGLLAAAGIKACPADAQPIIKAIPGIKVLSRRGGGRGPAGVYQLSSAGRIAPATMGKPIGKSTEISRSF